MVAKKLGLTRRRFIKTLGIGSSLIILKPGMGVVYGAKEKEAIVIGYHQGLSGPFAAASYWQAKAATVAVERINKTGGISGRPVRLALEDDELKVATGVRKMRKLLLDDEADFILGSTHAGVDLACIPLAKEFKTIYWPMGQAREILGEGGNRYVFHSYGTVAQQMKAVISEELIKDMGSKWSIMYADYAYGQSLNTECTGNLTKLGINVLGHIPYPMGTSDFVPYILKIPSPTEAMLVVVPGADILPFYKQMLKSGPKVNMISSVGAFLALTPIDFKVLEGFRVVEIFPVELKYKDTPYAREYRRLMGIDEHGKEIGENRWDVVNYDWYTWEAISWIKKGIEDSGWKSKKDNLKFMEALEGASVKESLDFPQGAKTMRAQDHQCFVDHWVSIVREGRLVVERRVPKEKGMYPPDVDRTKEKI